MAGVLTCLVYLFFSMPQTVSCIYWVLHKSLLTATINLTCWLWWVLCLFLYLLLSCSLPWTWTLFQPCLAFTLVLEVSALFLLGFSGSCPHSSFPVSSCSSFQVSVKCPLLTEVFGLFPSSCYPLFFLKVNFTLISEKACSQIQKVHQNTHWIVFPSLSAVCQRDNYLYYGSCLPFRGFCCDVSTRPYRWGSVCKLLCFQTGLSGLMREEGLPGSSEFPLGP